MKDLLKLNGNGLLLHERVAVRCRGCDWEFSKPRIKIGPFRGAVGQETR